MATKFRDYYETLGVPKTATYEEIRAAFRKLARKHHPDVAKDKAAAEEKFKEINEAYEVLGDAEKRKKYDSFGEHWQHAGAGAAGGAGPAGGGFPGGGFPDFSTGGDGVEFEFSGTGFSDFFEAMFGARRGNAYQRGTYDYGFDRGPRRGQDVEADILVTIEEALHGSTRQISFRPGSEKEPRTYTVKIPKGVREGQRIRLAGVGGSGQGGAPAGDLFLRVKLQKHPDFRVEGSDVFHDLELPAAKAVLGCEARVPTLDGTAKLRIPPGAQSGHRFRFAGKGLPDKVGGRGDFYVVLDPQLPQSVSDKERELWEQLARLHD